MRKPSLLERLRAKKHSPRPVIGVAWYDELNWAMVKATALDAYRFENSFAEWLAMATQTLANLVPRQPQAERCRRTRRIRGSPPAIPARARKSATLIRLARPVASARPLTG